MARRTAALEETRLGNEARRVVRSTLGMSTACGPCNVTERAGSLDRLERTTGWLTDANGFRCNDKCESFLLDHVEARSSTRGIGSMPIP
jgi:hypothetical protein